MINYQAEAILCRDFACKSFLSLRKRSHGISMGKLTQREVDLSEIRMDLAKWHRLVESEAGLVANI